MKKITSRDNATFKQLRLLAESARERRKQGKTVLDGMHLVSEWFARFGRPELLAVSEAGVQQAEISDFLARHSQLEPYVLDDGLFRKVSPVTTPTGILALIRIPNPPLATKIIDSCVLLETIQDSGNLGAILRTAAAAGIADVFLGPGCAQAWSPRVLRAAMGAHIFLRIHEHAALHQVVDRFNGISVSTRLDAQCDLFELDLSGPVAWVFGNEGVGMTADTAGLTSHAARIPMPGGGDSLNVAAAVSICLFEEVRQKMAIKRRGGQV